VGISEQFPNLHPCWQWSCC